MMEGLPYQLGSFRHASVELETNKFRTARMKRIAAVALLVVAGALAGGAQELTLPNRPASVKFAVIGDNGTGDPPEYDIGRQMRAYHSRVPFELVIMLGDNLYGRQEPQDFVKKFEAPFRPLLDAGVRFYAALGNHDNPNQVRYPRSTWVAPATTRTPSGTSGSS